MDQVSHTAVMIKSEQPEAEQTDHYNTQDICKIEVLHRLQITSISRRHLKLLHICKILHRLPDVCSRKPAVLKDRNAQHRFRPAFHLVNKGTILCGRSIFCHDLSQRGRIRIQLFRLHFQIICIPEPLGHSFFLFFRHYIRRAKICHQQTIVRGLFFQILPLLFYGSSLLSRLLPPDFLIFHLFRGRDTGDHSHVKYCRVQQDQKECKIFYISGKDFSQLKSDQLHTVTCLLSKSDR